MLSGVTAFDEMKRGAFRPIPSSSTLLLGLLCTYARKGGVRPEMSGVKHTQVSACQCQPEISRRIPTSVGACRPTGEMSSPRPAPAPRGSADRGSDRESPMRRARANRVACTRCNVQCMRTVDVGSDDAAMRKSQRVNGSSDTLIRESYQAASTCLVDTRH